MFGLKNTCFLIILIINSSIVELLGNDFLFWMVVIELYRDSFFFGGLRRVDGEVRDSVFFYFLEFIILVNFRK